MADVVNVEAPIDVAFASSVGQALQSGLTDPAIVITPDYNTWNDYGWQLFAKVAVVVGGAVVQSGPIRLMFQGEISTAVALTRLLAAPGPVMRVEQSPANFLSLMPTPERYAELVNLLGFDRTVVALRKLSDATLARAVAPTEAQQEMMDSDAFWEGVLRSDDAYGALRRGLRGVRRAPQPVVVEAAADFMVRAKLPSSVEHHRVEFIFQPDSFDRNRVSVLIGRNGVGKTQLLRRIVEAQTDEYEAEQIAIEPRRTFGRVLVFSSVTSDPYPRTIPPWAGVDYEYFSMTAPTDFGADALLQALVAIRRDSSDRLDEGQTFRKDLFETVLRPFKLLSRLCLPLRAAKPGQSFPGEINREGKRYFPFGAPLKEQFELLLIGEIDWARTAAVLGDGGPRQLSSGETAIFRFAAQAVASISQGSLLLFDEPETHLHPNYVSDFMVILQDLLHRTQSVAIIATHSAYVVREVPRERVNVMTVIDGSPSADSPRLQTFGASIDSISQFVFNDGGVPHWHLERLRKWVAGPGADLTIHQIIEQYGTELNPETLSYIGELKRGGEQPA